MPPALPAPVLTFAIDNLSKLDSLNDDDISAMWGVFTKCKDNLENGRRLENMSWRLWYRSVHLSNTTTTPANLSLSNTTVVQQLDNFPPISNHSSSVSPSSVNKILASCEINSLTASVDPSRLQLSNTITPPQQSVAPTTTTNVVVNVFEPDTHPPPVTIVPPPLHSPSGSTASSSSGSSTTLHPPSALRRTPRMTAIVDDENVATPEPLRTSPNRPAPIMRVEFDPAHSPAHSPGSPSRDQRKVKFYISESSSDDGGRRAAARAMMEAGRNAPPTQEQIQLQQQRQQQNVVHQQQQNILLQQQQQILQRQHQQQQMQQQWYPYQSHQQPPLYPHQHHQQPPQAPVYAPNVAFVPVAPAPLQQPILPPEYIAQLNPAQRQLLMSHLQQLPSLNPAQQNALAQLQMYFPPQQSHQPQQLPRATFRYEDDEDSEFDDSDSEFDSEFSDSEEDALSPRPRRASPDPMFAKLSLAASNSPPSTTSLVRNRSALSLALRSNSGILPPPQLVQQQQPVVQAAKVVWRDDFRTTEMSESVRENLAWDRRAMFGAKVGRKESVEDVGEWEEQLDGEEIW
ncbi:hypothetical protein BJ742DRAFT_556114 [Cladochytrium replicatum]|nr:hypothetical protein BJ742DRAFT_556114 [Cladochytrium replicatum]